MLKPIFAASAAALLLAACGTPRTTQPQLTPAPDTAQTQSQPQNPTAISPDALRRVWLLTEFRQYTPKTLRKLGARLDLRHLPRVHANMGCNNLMMNAQADTQSGEIRFGLIMATLMYCHNNMQLERTFSDSVGEQRFRYHSDGQTLTLQSADGTVLRFTAQ